MRAFYAFCGATAVLALLVLAGCGKTVIDGTKTEEQLQASLSKSLGEKVSSVDCPTDVEVEKGTTFTCDVELKKGDRREAVLKIENEDADVSVTELRPVGEDRSRPADE